MCARWGVAFFTNQTAYTHVYTGCVKSFFRNKEILAKRVFGNRPIKGFARIKTGRELIFILRSICMNLHAHLNVAFNKCAYLDLRFLCQIIICSVKLIVFKEI